jgi:hypothetical protein
LTPSAGPVRLGPVRPGSSDTLDVAISDDRRTIGVAFSTFEVEVRQELPNRLG